MQLDNLKVKSSRQELKTKILVLFAVVIFSSSQCGSQAPEANTPKNSDNLNKIFSKTPPPAEIINDAKPTITDKKEPTVLSISVLPAQVTLFPAGKKNIEVFAEFSDRSRRLLTGGIELEVEDPAVVRVEGNTTLVGVNVGVTQAFVSVGTHTENIVIEVRSIDVSRIDIQPSTVVLAQRTKFSAVAHYSDGSNEDVSAQVEWHTLDASTLALDDDASEPGTFIGNKIGEASISASFNGKSTSKIISVQTLPIVSLTLESGSPQILLGAPVQLRAYGRFSNDEVLEITSSVIWHSENMLRGSVSNEVGSEGLLTTLQPGSLIVGATLGDIAASLTLNITSANFASIRIDPAELKAGFGMELQARLIGVMANGDEQDITNQAIWSSGQTTIASVSNLPGKQGLIQALSEGTVEISAQYGTRLAVKNMIVGGAALVEIEVSTTQSSVACGTAEPEFTAKGFYSDSSEADITDQVSWSSGNQNVAIVSNSPGSKGVVTTVGVGSTYIQASILEPITGMNIIGSNQVEASDPVLASLKVRGAGGKTSIPAGEKLQLSVEGLYTCPMASPEDFTAESEYSADFPALVTIGLPGPVGQINAISSPENNTAVVITAVYTSNGFDYTGEFHMTVRPKEIKSILTTTENSFVEVGQTLWIKPRVTYTDNSQKILEISDLGTMILTRQIQSPNPNTVLATIDQDQGTITGVAEGTYTLRLLLQTSYGNFSNQIYFSTRSQCNFGIRHGLYCWYVSARGESCDQACSNLGGNAVPQGIIDYAGSAGASDSCSNILFALNWNGITGVVNPNETFAGGQGLGCSIFDNGSFRVGKRYISPDTTTDALFPDFRRICACDK